MILKPVASQSVDSIVKLNEISSPLSPYCIFYRWAWSSTEEDLHQMGELSLRPSDLSHWWLVHWPARWPHAYPPSGSALRRTAGQYHTESTHSCPKLNLSPQHDRQPCTTSQEEGEITCFIASFFSDLLLLLLLLVFLFLNSCCTFLLICVMIFLFSNFNIALLLPFSSAPHSQSLLRAACVSTAWRMLTKPYSFSKSKKSI